MNPTDLSLDDLDRAEAEIETGKRGMRFDQIGSFEPNAPSFLIQDVLERDSQAGVIGDSGSGKTFAVLSLAACIATGKPFAGHSVAHSGPVLYAAGEGRAGLVRRFHAWAKANGVDPLNVPLYLADRGAGLIDADQIAELRAAVRKVAQLHGVPVILIVDTWARALSGADENSAADAGQAIAVLDELRREYGGMTTLVIHHLGAADKTRGRGSTALKAALDSEFLVARNQSSTILLTATKTKDGPTPAPMAFELEDVFLKTLEDGRKVSSAWARPVEYVAESRPAGKNQSVALEVLKQLYAAQKQTLDGAGFAGREALVLVSDWRQACEAAGLDRRRFSEVKASLVDSGKVFLEGPHALLDADAVSGAASESGGTIVPPGRRTHSAMSEIGVSDAFGHFGQNPKGGR
ncbi:MAG TPA: hypothetical protein DCG47_15265 [Spirochaetaceae bacterium]|jgi:hypothetical protein|nr:hypothetical protein [Spirochaetaceae bacterium]